MYVSVQASMTLDIAQAEVSYSFLCSQREGTGCLPCHSSCNGCNADGTCASCKAAPQATLMASNTACVCRGNYGSDGNPFMDVCALCHPSCATCEWANDPVECFTCIANHATSTDPLGGYCYCDPGYQDLESPTSDCQSCTGCSHCAAADTSACMSEEQAAFNRVAVALHGLPTVPETAGTICYRKKTTSHDCLLTALEAITGDIHTATPGTLTPSTTQCFQLLKAEWPMLTYWFAQIFPTFSPPASTTERSYLIVKTILQLWILQFGPDQLKFNTDWMAVVALFNKASDQWALISATSAGYVFDSASFSFPQDLTGWFIIHPADLAAFNTFSA